MRVYEYYYSAMLHQSVAGASRASSSPTARLSTPTAVRQIWLEYIWVRRQGYSPLSDVARRLLQQKLMLCRALRSTTMMHHPVYCMCSGCIVYCILCRLFFNLFEVHRRSFSHRTVKVVLCVQVLILIIQQEMQFEIYV